MLPLRTKQPRRTTKSRTCGFRKMSLKKCNRLLIRRYTKLMGHFASRWNMYIENWIALFEYKLPFVRRHANRIPSGITCGFDRMACNEIFCPFEAGNPSPIKIKNSISTIYLAIFTKNDIFIGKNGYFASLLMLKDLDFKPQGNHMKL
ncbi:hypothetical protein D3C73_1293580 [compost metagenome]